MKICRKKKKNQIGYWIVHWVNEKWSIECDSSHESIVFLGLHKTFSTIRMIWMAKDKPCADTVDTFIADQKWLRLFCAVLRLKPNKPLDVLSFSFHSLILIRSDEQMDQPRMQIYLTEPGKIGVVHSPVDIIIIEVENENTVTLRLLWSVAAYLVIRPICLVFKSV